MTVEATTALLDRLRRHFIKPGEALPGGAFLTEIESHAAPCRRIDALYVGFARSRGHLIQGFELKTSRQDWEKELAQPDKAEWWFERTHRWWLVVSDASIIGRGELPPGWGVMRPHPRRKTMMEILQEADLREPLIDFGLFFQVVKRIDTLRAQGLLRERNERDHQIHKAVEAFRTSARAEIDQAYEAQQGREAIETLTKLADLTGLNIPGAKGNRQNRMWASLEDTGEALRSWCQSSVVRQRGALATRTAVERAHGQISKVLEDLRSMEPG